MESDSLTSRFDEIEKRVERLVETLDVVEAENKKLKNKNKQLEEELQVKAETEIRYRQERESIRSKIDGLLLKLETMAGSSP